MKSYLPFCSPDILLQVFLHCTPMVVLIFELESYTTALLHYYLYYIIDERR